MDAMSFAWVDDFCVVVHSAEPFSDAEWSHYCDALRNHGRKIRGQFIWGAKGAVLPTAVQRARVRNVWVDLGYTPPMAILTDSTIVRYAITAMNWFVGADRIRAFLLDDFEGALRYLEIHAQPTRTAILESHEAQKKKLGINE